MTAIWTLKKDKAGFTLFEVMIALAILAIALVLLLGLRNTDMQVAETSERMTLATFLAQEKMTEVELAGFPDQGEHSGDFEDRYPGFYWHETVVPTPFDFAREVEIAVSWQEGGGERSVDLHTYVFQNE